MVHFVWSFLFIIFEPLYYAFTLMFFFKIKKKTLSIFFKDFTPKKKKRKKSVMSMTLPFLFATYSIRSSESAFQIWVLNNLHG